MSPLPLCRYFADGFGLVRIGDFGCIHLYLYVTGLWVNSALAHLGVRRFRFGLVDYPLLLVFFSVQPQVTPSLKLLTVLRRRCGVEDQKTTILTSTRISALIHNSPVNCRCGRPPPEHASTYMYVCVYIYMYDLFSLIFTCTYTTTHICTHAYVYL